VTRLGDKPVRSVRTAKYDKLLGLLKELRAESGMTQKQLCDRLGQDLTYISKIERGTRRLDLIEFFDLAEALGQDPIGIALRFTEMLND